MIDAMREKLALIRPAMAVAADRAKLRPPSLFDVRPRCRAKAEAFGFRFHGVLDRCLAPGRRA
jgi:hypothetical protein